MKVHLSDEVRSLAERRVLDSLVRLTEAEPRFWVYFTRYSVIDNMRTEHKDTDGYGFVGNENVSEFLGPYCQRGLVLRPMNKRFDKDEPHYIKTGGYRANHERLDELKEIIGDIE